MVEPFVECHAGLAGMAYIDPREHVLVVKYTGQGRYGGCRDRFAPDIISKKIFIYDSIWVEPF